MKTVNALLLTVVAVLLLSCKKTIIIDNMPMLEIRVLDSNGLSVSNARVMLYTSETDWLEQTNEIMIDYTNSQGFVLFEDLEMNIYYIYAYKGELSNKESVSALEKALQLNVKAKITTIIK